MKNLKRTVLFVILFSLSAISYSKETSFLEEGSFFNFNSAVEIFDRESISPFKELSILLGELSSFNSTRYELLYRYNRSDISNYCSEFKPVSNNEVRGFILEESPQQDFQILEFSSVNICDLNRRVSNLDTEDFYRIKSPLLLQFIEESGQHIFTNTDIFTNTGLAYIEPEKTYSVKCSSRRWFYEDESTLCLE